MDLNHLNWFIRLVYQNHIWFIRNYAFSDGSVMKTYESGMDLSLFACEPAGMDLSRDLWSPNCGTGCGMGWDLDRMIRITTIIQLW